MSKIKDQPVTLALLEGSKRSRHTGEKNVGNIGSKKDALYEDRPLDPVAMSRYYITATIQFLQHCFQPLPEMLTNEPMTFSM